MTVYFTKQETKHVLNDTALQEVTKQIHSFAQHPSYSDTLYSFLSDNQLIFVRLLFNADKQISLHNDQPKRLSKGLILTNAKEDCPLIQHIQAVARRYTLGTIPLSFHETRENPAQTIEQKVKKQAEDIQLFLGKLEIYAFEPPPQTIEAPPSPPTCKKEAALLQRSKPEKTCPIL